MLFSIHNIKDQRQKRGQLKNFGGAKMLILGK